MDVFFVWCAALLVTPQASDISRLVRQLNKDNDQYTRVTALLPLARLARRQ